MTVANIAQFYQCGYTELRLPLRLAHDTLASKLSKELHLYLLLKSLGSRVSKQQLYESVQVSPRTVNRQLRRLVSLGWIGMDKDFIFLRSWKRIGYRKRRGIPLEKKYLKSLDRLEAVVFAGAIKRFYRRKEYGARVSGRATPNVFPSGYYRKALDLSLRTFERLKAKAVKYRTITSKVVYRILGRSIDYEQLRRNLHGPYVHRKGKYTVTPEATKIKVIV